MEHHLNILCAHFDVDILLVCSAIANYQFSHCQLKRNHRHSVISAKESLNIYSTASDISCTFVGSPIEDIMREASRWKPTLFLINFQASLKCLLFAFSTPIGQKIKKLESAKLTKEIFIIPGYSTEVINLFGD